MLYELVNLSDVLCYRASVLICCSPNFGANEKGAVFDKRLSGFLSAPFTILLTDDGIEPFLRREEILQNLAGKVKLLNYQSHLRFLTF